MCRIGVIRPRLPVGTGRSLLYCCPGCKKPRRYLYRHSMSGGRLVDYHGWGCQECSGLRWASQGRYRMQLERDFFLAVYGGRRVREPLPRHRWDPGAVSDPRLVVDEFAGQLVEAAARGTVHSGEK